ncbi:low molecular weight protein-tyrosine-phosphatase [Paraburkholderia phymatum]|uniref:protein-tyrosine-phosphatase n=1 Tax=Paraburkholderia phymatum (strain DSM 17167 / CIP 108236 / LMG 21445 / STM815) TaxID=391038 RepID=B2JS56_PARP8|nr:protein tyrosine phosphatase [Paraburkholderia phymatum STM815]
MVINDILVTCTGNICRSPTAEIILRHRLAARSISVTSAGISALVGRPICDKAAEILAENGHSSVTHRAKQVTPTMLRQSDLILTMSHRQRNHICSMMPEVRGKVFLLGKWDAGIEIPDPYRRDRRRYEHIYGLIEKTVESWLMHL